MSLINDALKKAQRQRTGDPGSALPTMQGGGRGPSKMGTPMLVLIGAGLVLLVVLAVVATVMYVSPKTPEPVAVVTKPAAPAISPSKPPQVVVASAAATPPVVSVESAKASPTPAPADTAPVINVAPLVAATPDEQVQALIDKMRVTGVRTSASGSKVLMNDHIVRLNDLVDRDSGLRLVKIEDGTLTFKDKQGATYIKSY